MSWQLTAVVPEGVTAPPVPAEAAIVRPPVWKMTEMVWFACTFVNV